MYLKCLPVNSAGRGFFPKALQHTCAYSKENPEWIRLMNRRTVDEACMREREMNMANNSDDTYGMREDDDDDGETSKILSFSLDSV